MRFKLSTLVPIIVFVVWLVFLRPTFLYGDTSYVIVAGRSMEPTLRQGDLAVLKAANAYSVGDIVGYVSPYGPIVIHRIIGVKDGVFTTKGDNATSADPWQVTNEAILGKLVFSVPYIGVAISLLRQPHMLAFAIASLAFLSVALPSKADKKRKRNKRRFVWPNRLPKQVLTYCMLAVFLALSGYAVFYTQSLPAERSRFVELYRYEHVGNFNYTVELKPNILFNTSTIGPGQPIYLTLAKYMNIEFSYLFNSTSQTEVAGNYTVYMELEKPKEWVKRFTLIETEPFNSTDFTFTHKLNMTSIVELIQAIESETGVRGSSYELRISPHINIEAKVENNEIEESFNPNMTITFEGNKLTVEGLKQTKPKVVGQIMSEPATQKIFGAEIPVTFLRYLSYIALACSAAATSIAYYKGTPATITEKIKRKYGHIIIDVKAEPKHPEGAVTIEVASIKDLAKIAQETGKLIMHQQTGTLHTYQLFDGQIIYKYETCNPIKATISEIEKQIEHIKSEIDNMKSLIKKNNTKCPKHKQQS